MVLKVYISGMSGNKEVKKRQQRVLMILDSKNIKYECVDITEPGRESDREFMQTNSTSSGATISDQNPRHPLPPQFFNEEEYCGDYDAFDLANEIDTLEQFLKLVPADTTNISSAQIELKKENGEKKPENDAVTEDNKENQEVKENGKAANETSIEDNKTSENEETPAVAVDDDDGSSDTKKETEGENVENPPETNEDQVLTTENKDEKKENTNENTPDADDTRQEESTPPENQKREDIKEILPTITEESRNNTIEEETIEPVAEPIQENSPLLEPPVQVENSPISSNDENAPEEPKVEKENSLKTVDENDESQNSSAEALETTSTNPFLVDDSVNVPPETCETTLNIPSQSENESNAEYKDQENPEDGHTNGTGSREPSAE